MRQDLKPGTCRPRPGSPAALCFYAAGAGICRVSKRQPLPLPHEMAGVAVRHAFQVVLVFRLRFPEVRNQVEIWLGIFQRKTLNNASFGSIEQLVQAVHAFTAAYNVNAAPFVWRKREVRSAQLRNTIVDLSS